MKKFHDEFHKLQGRDKILKKPSQDRLGCKIILSNYKEYDKPECEKQEIFAIV